MHVRALRALPNIATPAPSNSFLLSKRCLLTLALTQICQHVALHLSHTSLPCCQAAPPSAAMLLPPMVLPHKPHSWGMAAWIAFCRSTVNLSMIAMSAPGPIRQASVVSCMTGFCGLMWYVSWHLWRYVAGVDHSWSSPNNERKPWKRVKSASYPKILRNQNMKLCCYFTEKDELIMQEEFPTTGSATEGGAPS